MYRERIPYWPTITRRQSCPRHRLPATRLHRRQCARHIPGGAAHQHGCGMAGQSIVGAANARLAMDSHDGRRAGLGYFLLVAADEGTAAARRESAAKGTSRCWPCCAKCVRAKRFTYRCSSVLRSAPLSPWGMLAWRAPFLIKDVRNWNEARIGKWMGLTFLSASLDRSRVRHIVCRMAPPNATRTRTCAPPQFSLPSRRHSKRSSRRSCRRADFRCYASALVPAYADLHRPYRKTAAIRAHHTHLNARSGHCRLSLHVHRIFGALGSQVDLASITQRVVLL